MWTIAGGILLAVVIGLCAWGFLVVIDEKLTAKEQAARKAKQLKEDKL